MGRVVMASPTGVHKFLLKPGNWCYGQRYLELLVCFETGSFHIKMCTRGEQ